MPHTSCGNGCNRPNNAPLTGFATRPDPAGCCSKLLEHHANVLCAGGWPGPALVPPRATKPVTTLLCMAGIEELTHYSLSWWARCVQNLFAIQCPGTASVVGHSPTCCASAVPHHECIVPCGNPVIMHPMPLQHRAATPIEAWSGSGLQRPSRWVSAFAPNMPCVLMRTPKPPQTPLVTVPLPQGLGKGCGYKQWGKSCRRTTRVLAPTNNFYQISTATLLTRP